MKRKAYLKRCGHTEPERLCVDCACYEYAKTHRPAQVRSYRIGQLKVVTENGRKKLRTRLQHG